MEVIHPYDLHNATETVSIPQIRGRAFLYRRTQPQGDVQDLSLGRSTPLRYGLRIEYECGGLAASRKE